MGTAKFVLIATLSFAVISSVNAQDVKPIAPSNPVELSVEVGSVAGQSSTKVVVVLKATVGKKGTTFTTLLQKHGSFDFTQIELEPGTTAGLIAALGETTANADADYTKDVGALHIENRDHEGKRMVSIRLKEAGISFQNKRIDVDTDNATTLQTQLKKLQGIQAWMKDKVTVFEKK